MSDASDQASLVTWGPLIKWTHPVQAPLLNAMLDYVDAAIESALDAHRAAGEFMADVDHAERKRRMRVELLERFRQTGGKPPT